MLSPGDDFDQPRANAPWGEREVVECGSVWVLAERSQDRQEPLQRAAALPFQPPA